MFGLNKITLYIFAAVFLFGAATTTYYVWKRNIEHAALLEFNRAQMEQNARDQQEFMRRQSEVAEDQRRVAAELAEQTRRIQTRMNRVSDMINTSPDSPAPDVIRRTIEQLREGAGR